jgi:hypothetical protein
LSQHLRFRSTVRLDVADHDVDSALAALVSFAQHGVRFAHACRSSDKNLEPTPYVILALNRSQEVIGIRSHTYHPAFM